MIFKAIFLIAFIFIATSQQTTIQFQIRKRKTLKQEFEKLGKLTVTIFQQPQIIEAHVEPFKDQFVSRQDFQNDNPVIIEFVGLKSNIEEYRNRVYMTSIDQINSEAHGQKISLITGLDQARLAINSINYVQTHSKIGEIFTEILYTREQEGEVFKIVQAAKKKSEQEEQSFFSRYKWPLIIGGVVLYTMMTVDPQKAQQAAAAGRS